MNVRRNKVMTCTENKLNEQRPLNDDQLPKLSFWECGMANIIYVGIGYLMVFILGRYLSFVFGEPEGVEDAVNSIMLMAIATAIMSAIAISIVSVVVFRANRNKDKRHNIYYGVTDECFYEIATLLTTGAVIIPFVIFILYISFWPMLQIIGVLFK